MPAASKKWMQCSLCKKTVFDSVITRHMWKAHHAHMMKGRNKRLDNMRAKKAKSIVEAPPTKVGAKVARHPFAFEVFYEILGARIGKKTAEQALDAIETILKKEIGR